MKLFARRPPLAATLALGPHQIWSHEVERPPLHLRCVAGTLWLTWPGGPDRILRPGDTWISEGRGRVVVEALAPSRVAVRIGAPAAGERIELPHPARACGS